MAVSQSPLKSAHAIADRFVREPSNGYSNREAYRAGYRSEYREVDSGVGIVESEPVNPFAAPRGIDFRNDEVEYNPHAILLAADVERKILFRRIALRGRWDADIVWNARGSTEFVSVQGLKTVGAMSWWYQPRFDFRLPCEFGFVPASVDVDVSWLFKVNNFCLKIDGEIAYQETNGVCIDLRDKTERIFPEPAYEPTESVSDIRVRV